MPAFFLRVLGLAAAAALAACGGGGSPGSSGGPPPAIGPGQSPPLQGPGQSPTILRFEAAITALHVGDSVRVRADFSGGEARIEPEGLAVQPGQEALIGPLAQNVTLRLVVSRAGQPDALRELPLRVDFRERYLDLDLNLAASRHAALATADGRVLVIGGVRADGAPSSRIDRYDPRTHTFTHIGDLAQGRALATATRLDGGRVLVVGGQPGAGEAPVAELVDERSGAVVPAGRLGTARSGHAAIALPDGRVLVTGGFTAGEGGAPELARSAEIWEPATRQFRTLAATMLEPRAHHTMSLLPDGRVLVVGGYSSTAMPLFAELFDPRTDQFSSLAVWWRPRAEHAAFVQPDGRVLIVGGEQPRSGSPEWGATASVLRFDPQSMHFESLPPLAVPRSGVRGALTPDGELLLFGGVDAAGAALASAERYDPVRGGARHGRARRPPRAPQRHAAALGAHRHRRRRVHGPGARQPCAHLRVRLQPGPHSGVSTATAAPIPPESRPEIGDAQHEDQRSPDACRCPAPATGPSPGPVTPG